jgi:Cof subfamily protein (haloacid dehalogenase superfamily)
MEYKLLALDLDGTLLTSEHKITEHARSVLRSANEMGTVVTVATGRMYISALPYAKELAMDIPLIAHNGAMVKSSLSSEILYRRPLPFSVLSGLIPRLRHYGLVFMAYYDSAIYVEKGFSPKSKGYVKFTVVEAIEVNDMVNELPEPPLSISVRGTAEDIHEVYQDLKLNYGDQVHLVKSFPTLLEIHEPQVSKGYALKRLARYMGISFDQVIAVGDNLNDIEMIEAAGLGIAMGNSPQELKDIADYVAPSNDEDGVAYVVEKFILSNSVKFESLERGKGGERAILPDRFLNI